MQEEQLCLVLLVNNFEAALLVLEVLGEEELKTRSFI